MCLPLSFEYVNTQDVPSELCVDSCLTLYVRHWPRHRIIVAEVHFNISTSGFCKFLFSGAKEGLFLKSSAVADVALDFVCLFGYWGEGMLVCVNIVRP